MIQDIIFEKSEADNWFLRNKEAIINKDIEHDYPCRLVKNLKSKDNIKSVLELGASNGYRLNALKNILPDCKKFVGVDASQMAVEDGKKRYGLSMYTSKIDDFNSEEEFDLVIVNFVYHWIDRKTIFEAVANTDKLVKDGGYLLIGDFCPDFPQKRKYHHLANEKVYTYKADYTKVFEALNTYKIISKEIFNHDDKNCAETDSSNRAQIAILKKDVYGYYHEI